MTRICYSLQELRALQGTEDHLRNCSRCRNLYREVCRFDAVLEGEKRRAAEILPAPAQAARGADAGAPAWVDLCRQVQMLASEARSIVFRDLNASQALLDRARGTLDSLPESVPAKEASWCRARFHVSSGGLAALRGRMMEATRCYETAIDIYRSIGEEYRAALIVEGLLFTLTKLGRPESARRRALAVLPLLREYGARKILFRFWNNLSLVELASGRIDRAVRINESLISRVPSEDECRTIILYNRPYLLMFLGRYAEAIGLLREVMYINEKRGMTFEWMRNLVLLGELALRMGEDDLADDCLRRASLIQEEQAAGLVGARIRVLLAALHLRRGELESYRRLLGDAIRFLTREGISRDFITTMEDLLKQPVRSGMTEPEASIDLLVRTGGFFDIRPPAPS